MNILLQNVMENFECLSILEIYNKKVAIEKEMNTFSKTPIAISFSVNDFNYMSNFRLDDEGIVHKSSSCAMNNDSKEFNNPSITLSDKLTLHPVRKNGLMVRMDKKCSFCNNTDCYEFDLAIPVCRECILKKSNQK